MNTALHTLFNPPKVVIRKVLHSDLNDKESKLLEYLMKQKNPVTIREAAEFFSVCESTMASRLFNLTKLGYLKRNFKSVKNEGYNNYKNVIVYKVV